MNHLEMPGSLSGGGLKRNQAGTVQIVTGVVTPIIVYGDAIGRDINQVERRIGGKRAQDEMSRYIARHRSPRSRDRIRRVWNYVESHLCGRSSRRRQEYRPAHFT